MSTLRLRGIRHDMADSDSDAFNIGTSGDITFNYGINVLGSMTKNGVDVQTVMSAGSGLDLTGSTFSIEPDLRDGITHVGRDTSDYIAINTSNIGFFVDGGERVRIENDGDLHADGNLVAYSTTISDERLKDNIELVQDALARINKLDGVSFTYKTNGKQSAGVIAQQVEQVLPQAVSETTLPLEVDNTTEYKVVNYDALSALFIEAFKEISDRLDKLEAK